MIELLPQTPNLSETLFTHEDTPPAVRELVDNVSRFVRQGPVFRKIFVPLAIAWTFFGCGPLFLLSDVIPGSLCVAVPLGLFGYFAMFAVGGWYWGRLVKRFIDLPTVKVADDHLAPGETIEVQCIQPIKRDVTIDSYTVRLVLQEWVRYTRGTDTSTDTHDIVIDTWEQVNYPASRGETLDLTMSFDLPPDAIHTWGDSNNRLTWLITVEIDLPGWGDFREAYPIVVLPQKGA